jgi:hypothetical protein
VSTPQMNALLRGASQHGIDQVERQLDELVASVRELRDELAVCELAYGRSEEYRGTAASEALFRARTLLAKLEGGAK